jgi:hypothetical protein
MLSWTCFYFILFFKVFFIYLQSRTSRQSRQKSRNGEKVARESKVFHETMLSKLYVFKVGDEIFR